MSTADQTWEEFCRTFLRIETLDGVLEVRPAALDIREGFLAGEAGPLHVITACNPQGHQQPVEANDEANQRLRAELDAPGVRDGLRVWLTTGYGTDADGEETAWREPGFTVAGLTRVEALALGRRYDQAAIFEWRDEPGGFRLVACDGTGTADELRGWRARLV